MTPDPPAAIPGPVACVFSAVIAIAVLSIVRMSQSPNLDAFPTVGSSGLLGSWWDGIKYLTNAAKVIQEGYKKHNGAPFKIATPFRWIVVISSRIHVEEVGKASNDVLSFLDISDEELNTDFTLGPEIHRSPYHLAVVRSQLTRNTERLYPELRDEIFAAFGEILDLKDDEWKSVTALTTVQQIICRATNRVFVGLPLCRNPDFVALNIKHTIDTFMGGLAIGFLPTFLRPLAVRFATNIPKNTRQGVNHLRPIIEERWKYLNDYGPEWTEKPNDLLSWLMEEAGPHATVESLTIRVLATNMLAIHTSSNAFTFALFNLAANPRYLGPLRKEVETIVENEGWSKASLGKMHKVDSFLKESLRMESLDMLGLARKVMNGFMFSDGTLVPKGTRIHAALRALHHDDALYENPEVFDPFRFARMREENGQHMKHQFSVTSAEYLSFGHGRQACPGRFFAAAELKTMLAHTVLAYDVKLEADATRPQSLCIGSIISANSTAKVMFRKRVRADDNH